MALPQSPWTMSKEDLEAVLATPMPSIQESLIAKIACAERRYLDEGIRRALGLWVSELEPELMFHAGESRPFGITAKGHYRALILIRWDENFYLKGKPRRIWISYRNAP